MLDWQKIVSRYHVLVWNTAYRLLGNHADAMDCAQETFISALKLSRQKQIRHWGGLLRRSATARALDQLRHRLRRSERTCEQSDWSAVPSHHSEPAQQIENHELGMKLREALAQIPAQQAEVFCLRCMDEMSYREIARQLDIKQGTVGVLLLRARSRLRELLSDTMVEAEGKLRG